MEWNAESVLDALNDFERKSEIPEILDQYLERIAKNGEIVFPWNKLKPLLKKKLEVVLDEFYETCPVETSVPVPNFETFNFDNLKKTILQAVDAFTSAPFTIQRLCELVTNPTKHYNRTDKYMRGIEKNVLVVSTIEPRSEQGDGINANNPMVNGILNDSPRDDNDTLNGHESTESVSSSNLNAASNHVLLENFANVFPSAVCIPPSTNICTDTEVDNNFMENQELELAPVEQIESAATSKDEEMDTREDEQLEKEQPQTSVNMGGETSDNDAPLTSVEMGEETCNVNVSGESSDNPEAESISDNPVEPVPSSDVLESVPNEALCSETEPKVSVLEDTEIKPIACQQDDTISQSDDNSEIVSEESSSVDVPDEVIEVADYINEVASDINKLDDYMSKVADVIKDSDITVSLQEDVSTVINVTESISTTELSEQCMDLESSTSSSEPEAPV